MLKKAVIIGFSGYATSGKDTATHVLMNSNIIPLTKGKFAFADALRDMAGMLNVYFPEIGKRYNDLIQEYGYDTAKVKFSQVREHLVAIGHGTRTCLGPRIWIDAVEHKIQNSNVQMAIISDVRYLNEVNFILNNNGIVIYLERPDVGPANDTEEQSIKEILYTNKVYKICNNSDLNDLETQIVNIISQRYDFNTINDGI